MAVTLVQFRDASGARRVAAAIDGSTPCLLNGATSTYELVWQALQRRETLEQVIQRACSPVEVDLAELAAAARLLPPIDHPDPAHMLLTGTGLTHLGSAQSRNSMHQSSAGEVETDSMRMFRKGLEGGKPAVGEIGVEPEWFYKGDGQSVVGTGAILASPAFAKDGSEEPELACIYVVDASGDPRRLGFCLANEFSDHITERGNYLSLAHSKLRPAALGAELISEIPADIHGSSKIWRNSELLWEAPFLTGEANMSHAIANLEYHHFKYPQFRRPGDVHVHFLGTATLSFAAGVRTQAGDIFEIAAAPFTLPLRNELGTDNSCDVVVTSAWSNDG